MFFIKLPGKQYFSYEHDLHSHILPGLDDGVKTMEEATEIVKRMLELGVKHFTFTPHIAYPLLVNGLENSGIRLKALKERLIRENIFLDAEIGTEYREGKYMFELLEKGKVVSFRENYVLLEHNFLAPSLRFEELVFKLQAEGFKPILAHPERYHFYESRIEKYCRELKSKGCRIQVNLLSFDGYYGKEAKRGALALMEAGLIDFVSGDIHSLQQALLIADFLHSKESNCLNKYMVL